MRSLRSVRSILIILVVCALLGVTRTQAKVKKVKPQRVTCYNRRSKCFLKHVKCPVECPKVKPAHPNGKECFLDCYSPKCEAVCRRRKPNCNGHGAACYDPRFIGGDGIVFYFHGRSNEHFSLISDSNLQINARFIGHRPAGRTRDYTWIQALGLMFGSHNFTLEAARVKKWDDQIDHLQFSYDGRPLNIVSSEWNSPNSGLKVERTSRKNSASVALPEVVEIFASVVPVSEEDNRIHNYQIPRNDSFAHLEVQFRFMGLSREVEGVLGRTYRLDFENTAKAGVEMPIVGGEDRYKTSSLLSADCKSCNVFSPEKDVGGRDIYSSSMVMENGTVDCTKGSSSGGYGIVCRK